MSFIAQWIVIQKELRKYELLEYRIERHTSWSELTMLSGLLSAESRLPIYKLHEVHWVVNHLILFTSVKLELKFRAISRCFQSPAHSKILFTDSVKVHESHSIINKIFKRILLLCKVSYWKVTKASFLSVEEKNLDIGTTGFEIGWCKMFISSLWCAQTVDNSNCFRKLETPKFLEH